MAVRFRSRRDEEPEINLVPFIDVLLVILIFLMLSTTFMRVAELQIDLPVASPQAANKHPREIAVAVSADGRYAIGGQMLEGRSVDALAAALEAAASGDRQVVVVLSADAAAPHQSVINVMDAARRNGMERLAFATRSGQGRTSSDGDAAGP